MAHVRRIREFVEGKEDFQCYTERLEQYFEAYSVADDKRVAVFLAVVGSQTYILLRNLITPDLPSTKTFDELKTALKDHFNQKSLVIAERSKFHSRKQKETETVSEYLAVLKKLSVECDFGVFLTQALRDRFVCGLKNEVIQKKLLAAADLTLQKATEIALAMEMAAKNTTEIMARPEGAMVNQVRRAGGRNSSNRFWRNSNTQGQQHNKAEKLEVTSSNSEYGDSSEKLEVTSSNSEYGDSSEKRCYICGRMHFEGREQRCYKCGLMHFEGEMCGCGPKMCYKCSRYHFEWEPC